MFGEVVARARAAGGAGAAGDRAYWTSREVRKEVEGVGGGLGGDDVGRQVLAWDSGRQKHFENKLFQSLDSRDHDGFKKYLDKMNDFEVHMLACAVDEHGLTLVHACSHHGMFESLRLLVDLFKQSSLKILKEKPLSSPASRMSSSLSSNSSRKSKWTSLLTEEQMTLQINQVVRAWVDLPTGTRDKWTALHLACRHKTGILFQYLVEELGADMTLKSTSGIDLLHKSAYHDNTYVLTYLIEKGGFDVTASLDDLKNTPLHYACDQKTDFAPTWLIAYGADINAPNEDGNTPLHLLVKNPFEFRSSKLVKELICKGANRDLKNALE